jgi:uncharacterized protein (DUF608 family)
LSPSSKCQQPACACHALTGTTASTRRDFLKTLGLGVGTLAVQPWSAMAGPFTRADFDRLVPADKRLRTEWFKSLRARGEPAVYRGSDLGLIGMPVGGICAGQLYLGGGGRLWHWDLFNRHQPTGAEHYAHPLDPARALEQGFALHLTANGQTEPRLLDLGHWKDISFTGQYPIGSVQFRDPDSPVSVRLEAFSPFIPLNTDDSTLPATVMEFTVTNSSGHDVEAELTGWLENAVCLYSGQARAGFHGNRVRREGNALLLECVAEEPPPSSTPKRPDILFDDFERETYETWTASGTAFGAGPVEAARMPAYQGDVGGHGKRLVNSHASAPGSTVEQKDAATGRLASRSFPLERDYITFLIGGGNHKDRTCMNLVVDGQVVRSATGAANNRLQPMSWDVRPWLDKTAQLVIVDDESGPWGNIGVDEIVFSDQPHQPAGPLALESDFGSMVLALLDSQPGDLGAPAVPNPEAPISGALSSGPGTSDSARAPFGQKLIGSVSRKLKLAAGASTKVAFLLTWHFPNLKLERLPPGRSYATRFDSARAIAKYVADNFHRLSTHTRLWHDTWYDSTLPYWFLDRTFLNTSILATSTCYRLGTGRFYAWEGVGCCEGTCGHVWQYAHAMARLFPELERQTREHVDFGLALQPDGAIHFRGECNDIPAIDAQAGTILRALREHQMSADTAFLQRTWPAIKKATQWLIAKDGNGDGLIEGNQHNTLDTDWFGPVAWLSGLYLAALRGAEAMAIEVGDSAFAAQCRDIFNTGRKNFVDQLFQDDYFVNKPDPKHLDAINSGTGCEIDQVMGQSWAWQVGLGRVLPEQQTLAALKSLWRYNFTPDVGPYRDAYKAGRWYAMPGEAGLLMCTFPRSDWDYAQAKGKGPEWAAGYFNECMNGFEYQVAGHMIWEGLVTEGLAVTRAIHDRYHPSRRNPWNEVECGDHYARSMASYGVFLAACGFEYHGPKGHIGFAPRLTPEDFKAPFTTAQGWGTFTQHRAATAQTHRLDLKWGELTLKTLAFELPVGAKLSALKVTQGSRALSARSALSNRRLEITLESPCQLHVGESLEISCDLVA